MVLAEHPAILRPLYSRANIGKTSDASRRENANASLLERAVML